MRRCRPAPMNQESGSLVAGDPRRHRHQRTFFAIAPYLTCSSFFSIPQNLLVDMIFFSFFLFSGERQAMIFLYVGCVSFAARQVRSAYIVKSGCD